jgi:hypothetical protein
MTGVHSPYVLGKGDLTETQEEKQSEMSDLGIDFFN